MNNQLTQAQAIEIATSGIWKSWTDHQKVEFQLFNDRLCMDFSAFHEAIENVLGRPVQTLEFAYPEHLRKEFLGEKPAPSFRELMEMIPEGKGLAVVVR